MSGQRKKTEQQLQREKRNSYIAELRMQGLTFKETGKKVGLSTGSVRSIERKREKEQQIMSGKLTRHDASIAIALKKKTGKR